VKAGAFTNLSRDHLDYHADMEDYFAAKMRLFSEVVDAGGAAVVWADDAWSERAMAAARARSLTVFSVGEAARRSGLVARKPGHLGQDLEIEHQGHRHQVMLPLIGAYQAANALVAAGLVLATGGDGAQGVRRARPAAAGARADRARGDHCGRARRSTSTTPTPPTRSARRSPRCARTSPVG
jgi:UDP-N-acetylmuramyl tripeptide synthase